MSSNTKVPPNISDDGQKMDVRPSLDIVRLKWYVAVEPDLARTILMLVDGKLATGIQKKIGTNIMVFFQRNGILMTENIGGKRHSVSTINQREIAQVSFKLRTGFWRTQDLAESGIEEYAEADAWRTELEQIAIGANVTVTNNDSENANVRTGEIKLKDVFDLPSLIKTPLTAEAIAKRLEGVQDKTKSPKDCDFPMLTELINDSLSTDPSVIAECLKEIGDQAELSALEIALQKLAKTHLELVRLWEKCLQLDSSSALSNVGKVSHAVGSFLELRQQLKEMKI